MPPSSPQPDPIRVIIADDHPVIIDGIRAHFTAHPRLQIVGVAAQFSDLHPLLATTAADVLILDLTGMHGSPLMTVQHIRRDHPSLRIIVFSSALHLAPELLQAGVHGYVLKDDHTQHLEQAIWKALTGDVFLSTEVAAYLSRARAQRRTVNLMPRELSVLKLMARGLGTIEIATQLGIAPHSVQNYITALRRKTGCDERTQLINWYRLMYGDESS